MCVTAYQHAYRIASKKRQAQLKRIGVAPETVSERNLAPWVKRYASQVLGIPLAELFPR